MPLEETTPTPYTEYHKDGSVWATGQRLNGIPTGYWEWFRKDGTRMRSGMFEDGQQVGEWTGLPTTGVAGLSGSHRRNEWFTTRRLVNRNDQDCIP